MSPGDLDREVVERHLLALDQALRNLQRHAGRPLEALEQDLDERWAVERGLLLCAQNALDVATHIAASAGHDAPSYAAAIEELGRLGVVDVEFANRFRAVAGFRNILVHGYLAVDTARMHALLNQQLDDFRSFALRVSEFISRQS